MTTPPPSSTSVITIAVALTRSGWRTRAQPAIDVEEVQRREREQDRASTTRSRARRSAAPAPTAPEPTRRIMRTRSLASTTRVRSSSVGQSHEVPSLISPVSTGGHAGLRYGARRTTGIPLTTVCAHDRQAAVRASERLEFDLPRSWAAAVARSTEALRWGANRTRMCGRSSTERANVIACAPHLRQTPIQAPIEVARATPIQIRPPAPTER